MDEKIGFTGSQSLDPMRDIGRILHVLVALPRSCTVVTGASIGVESFVAAMAHEQGLKVHAVVPANPSRVDRFWREHCTTFEQMPPDTSDEDLNEQVVALSDRLIAFPEYPEDDPRSLRADSWLTVTLARRARKPVDVHVLRS